MSSSKAGSFLLPRVWSLKLGPIPNGAIRYRGMGFVALNKTSYNVLPRASHLILYQFFSIKSITPFVMLQDHDFSKAGSEDSGFDENKSELDLEKERRLKNDKYDLALEVGIRLKLHL